MKVADVFEKVKQYLYIKDRLNKKACDPIYYEKNNILWLLDEILKVTSYLDCHEVSLRERLYYVQNKFNEIQKCKYCENKKAYNKFSITLTNTCNSKECLKKQKSETTIKIWNNNIKLSRKKEEERVCLGCKKTFVTKKKSKKYCTQNCFTTHNNRKNSQSTILKRIESYKKTTSTKEYKEKRKNNINIINANKKLSAVIKNKILSGEFTPCITNSWTKWSSYINDNGNIIKFRSNWEAVFWLINNDLKYESIRIPYSINDKLHIYIVDFEDQKNKILYEIKPKTNVKDPKNQKKTKAAIEWCKKNGYKYVIIDDSWFIENASKIDYEKQPQLENSMKQFLCS